MRDGSGPQINPVMGETGDQRVSLSLTKSLHYCLPVSPGAALLAFRACIRSETCTVKLHSRNSQGRGYRQARVEAMGYQSPQNEHHRCAGLLFVPSLRYDRSRFKHYVANQTRTEHVELLIVEDDTHRGTCARGAGQTAVLQWRWQQGGDSWPGRRLRLPSSTCLPA